MSVLETSVNSKDLILQDMSHYVEIYDILVFKATRVEFRKSCVLSLEFPIFKSDPQSARTSKRIVAFNTRNDCCS